MSASTLPGVAVLMSAYNGEKYLREQADSILNQRDVDVHLYVRDDGSTDTTLDIIREYIAANPGKISLTTGENLGPGRSFMELVYQVPDTYDYYAFSDQDDVWMEDKLIAGIRFLAEHHKELYVGNAMCVDKDLNEIGPKDKNAPDFSLYGIILSNRAYGCTMMYSNRFHLIFRDKTRTSKEAVSVKNHDGWAALIGAIFGVIAYDPECHMLYRQHGHNAVGAGTYDGMFKRVKHSVKLKARKLMDKSKRNPRSKISADILRLFPEEAARFPYLQMYAEPRKLENKIKLIRSYKEYREHGSQDFLSYCLYVCFNLI